MKQKIKLTENIKKIGGDLNLMNKKQLYSLLIFFVFFTNLYSQKKSKFSCPIKNGSLVTNTEINSDNQNPIKGLRFLSKDKNFYSSTKGKISKIDTIEGVLTVSFGNYTISYLNVEKFHLKENDVIKRGDLYRYS